MPMSTPRRSDPPRSSDLVDRGRLVQDRKTGAALNLGEVHVIDADGNPVK